MLLLVTDTSGKHGSVALVQASSGSNDVELIESVALAGGTFSAQLVPQIAALLAKHGRSKTGIDAFVVVSGPGSFTGLRVGLAAIKALAEILHKPIVPVSLLEAVALESPSRAKVLAVLDAGRGEVYVAEYDVAEQSARLARQELLPRREFTSGGSGLAVLTPDKDLAAIARDAGCSVFLVDPPGAQTIGQLGWKKLQSGQTVTPEQLEANYIRRSDAEIFAEPRS
jgi:tRNA threonylcarbamoyladenosine biosynthesis protein TsaB